MVHVVTVAGLRGAPVPTPVMGDDAVPVLEEEQHLGIPVVGRKRPAMAEDDRLTRAPVLVEDLGSVIRGDRAHQPSPRARRRQAPHPCMIRPTREPRSATGYRYGAGSDSHRT